MTASGAGPLITGLTWLARAVAAVFVLLGAMVFVSFLETGEFWYLGFSVLGVLGGLLTLFGLEDRWRAHPASQPARTVGWLMMAGFSFVPTSLLFVPTLLALLALPAALFGRGSRRARADGMGSTGPARTL